MKISIFILEISDHNLIKYVLISIVVIFGLMLIFFLIDKYLYNQRTKRIIQKYKGFNKEKNISDQKKKPITKGWGMNDSPFRDRKSGLTWGGGNIKGASAKRGTRRSFLK